ncbi:sulfatase [Aquimarina gracilis]|uniref:Sulfatase n=1 Tax=Aquimarina gracilis TaxID=874422 RepID=A0ABU5ZP15_9FLAO|nr:sulfatase [Aquimarina gracilis]MEB3343880.1 sulfatase [Aquimarina gracilis]
MNKLCLLSVSLLVLCACTSKKKDTIKIAKKPNVLFISIDDLNDWVEPLGGHPQAITPNLEEFAKRAMTFTNAHASAPLCNPSRVSIMTGLDPRNTGIVSNNAFYPFRKYLPDAETMIQHFKKEGYYTAGFGKVFHKEDSKTEPWDEYAWCSGRPKPTPYPGHGIKFITDSVYRYFDWGAVADSISKWGENQITQKVDEFFKKSHESPFFLAAGFRLPHLGWYTPPRFHKLYDSLDIQLPDFSHDDIKDVPAIILESVKKDRRAHDTIMGRGVWQDAVKSYLASVSYIDYELGRIMEKLKSSSYYENTIVIVWSDHGFHLGEKSTWRKNTLWEESTRVPLLIHAPEVTKLGAKTDHPVSLLDLYPTLVSLCGITPRDDLDGQNISELLSDPETKLDKDYVTTTNVLGTAIRNKNWRYIQYKDGSEELYDHRTDPLEHINLIGNSDYLDQLNKLRSYLSK